MRRIGFGLLLFLAAILGFRPAGALERAATDDEDCVEDVGANCPHVGIPFFWGSSSMPIPYLVNASGSGNSFGPVADAIETSFGSWQQASRNRIRFAFSGSTSQTVSGQDEQTVSWTSLEPGVFAQTSIFFDGTTGEIFEADIEFNSDISWAILPPDQVDGSDPRADIQATATHEAGHFLGLAHENTKGFDVVMFFSGETGDTTHRALSNDDIAGVRAIYRGSGGGGGCDLAPLGDGADGTVILALLLGLLAARRSFLSRGRRVG